MIDVVVSGGPVGARHLAPSAAASVTDTASCGQADGVADRLTVLGLKVRRSVVFSEDLIKGDP